MPPPRETLPAAKKARACPPAFLAPSADGGKPGRPRPRENGCGPCGLRTLGCAGRHLAPTGAVCSGLTAVKRPSGVRLARIHDAPCSSHGVRLGRSSSVTRLSSRSARSNASASSAVSLRLLVAPCRGSGCMRGVVIPRGSRWTCRCRAAASTAAWGTGRRLRAFLGTIEGSPGCLLSGLSEEERPACARSEPRESAAVSENADVLDGLVSRARRE